MIGEEAADRGNAIVEFVFLGIVVLVPLLYLVLAICTLERNVFAVTEAAREAGRAYATAADQQGAAARADYAARLALQDQGLPETAVLRYVPPAADCAAAPIAPSLAPGGSFAVCVVREISLPGVPGFLTGRRNTVTGRFEVHIDDYRAAA